MTSVITIVLSSQQENENHPNLIFSCVSISVIIPKSRPLGQLFAVEHFYSFSRKSFYDSVKKNLHASLMSANDHNGSIHVFRQKFRNLPHADLV